jgi:arginine N-succinyltransferase
MTTFTLRPVTYDDAEPLYQLTRHATLGLTSLPLTMDHCIEKIDTSIRTWADPNTHAGAYWFVLVENPSKRLIGCAMITPKSGQDKAILSFQKETLERHCSTLNIHTKLDILRLCRWQHHPTEIGGLFLHPNYRKAGVGRLLSLGRFMVMAMSPNRFDPMVIAQMRGVIDETGHAPFWDAVCKAFCPISYQNLDIHMRSGKQFILDLLPQIPIYVHMMPPEIQALLGKTHTQTEGAAHILMAEGFDMTPHIDIGDAGPILSANRDDIRIVRDSRKAIVLDTHAAPSDTKDTMSVDYLLATNTPTGVRITQAPIRSFLDHGIGIPQDIARALGITKGQDIWIAPAKSQIFIRRFSEWFTTLAAGQTITPSRDQENAIKRRLR